MAKKIFVVETEKERLVSKIWNKLGKNDSERRRNLFILLIVLLGTIIAVFYLGGITVSLSL